MKYSFEVDLTRQTLVFPITLIEAPKLASSIAELAVNHLYTRDGSEVPILAFVVVASAEIICCYPELTGFFMGSTESVFQYIHRGVTITEQKFNVNRKMKWSMNTY